MENRRLRITLMGLNYAPEPTGIAPYTTKLAERLTQAGHEVLVLTGYPHYPQWKMRSGYSGWSSRELINGVKVRRLRHAVPRRVTSIGRMHMELSFGTRLFFAGWGKPDVVLVVTPALFSSALVMLRKRLVWNKPAVAVWVQDIYSRGLEETESGSRSTISMMRRVETLVFRSADRVSVIHERFKDYLVSSLDVPAQQIEVIKNWTHVPQPAVPADREAIRARFGWSANDVVVLHAGNMGVKQGLGNVVAAARLADAKKSHVKFVLLGDGNQRQHLAEASEGINRVQFILPLPDDDFIAALRSADILLVNELSGMRETAVPSKLTSYFSTGRPVIAATDSASTTAGEVALSGGGIVVEPDNPHALLLAAETLHGDQVLTSRLGRSGKDYAENRLSEDAAIVQYTEWLQGLAAERER